MCQTIWQHDLLGTALDQQFSESYFKVGSKFLRYLILANFFVSYYHHSLETLFIIQVVD